MKHKKIAKTNAMRILDREGVIYETRSYEADPSDLSGMHAAQEIGQDPDTVFKTLVLHGEPGGYFVCCIPVDTELDLKKAARASGNKRCSMLHVRDLKDVTGYIRGGCSPIGMKKRFPTFLEQRALNYDVIGISAGLRGEQILIDPKILCDCFDIIPADLSAETE